VTPVQSAGGRPPWLQRADPEGIVMSARVRLARNVAGTAFPGWAGEAESRRLCRRLLPVLAALPPFAGGAVWRLDEMEALDRQRLRERHLISAELAGKGAGSALLVAADESLSVMVNEEDHLRIQAMAPGRDLLPLWRAADALDTAVGERIAYAVSPRLGYLTACPSNVGTGLRASVMLHLPGLRMAGEAGPVVKGLDKLGLAVRGLLGEGTDALGNMYQISNQATLGATERDLIGRLDELVGAVIAHERHARLRLLETQPVRVRDRVARALALLTQARVMRSEEALDLLSALRLGVALGWLSGLTGDQLHDFVLGVQPAHLQQEAGAPLTPDERDERRADWLRRSLAAVEWV